MASTTIGSNRREFLKTGLATGAIALFGTRFARAAAIGAAPVDDHREKFVIVTEYNRKVQGFLVDSVDRIVNMNWEEILPPPKGIGDENYLTAVTKVDGELVEIIDVEKVLAEVVGWNDEVSQEYIEQASDSDEARQPVVLVADDSSVARNQIKRTLQKLGV